MILVGVQKGRCRYTSAIPRTLERIGYENRFQQQSEATCVITSLANAMMYINDADAANTLMRHMELSLATTRRLQFVANLMNKLHYNVIKLKQFDILSNTLRWPTVCGLTGSDGGTTHAVTVCGVTCILCMRFLIFALCLRSILPPFDQVTESKGSLQHL